MRHQRRQRDQRLNPAEAFRQRAEVDAVEQPPRGSQPVEIEAKHGPEAALLALGNFVLWVRDRKSTRLNSSHRCNSYAVFCLKRKNCAFPLARSRLRSSTRTRPNSGRLGKPY